MVQTPTDFFLQWLGDRPLDARVAIAVDSDRLMADAGLLGKPTRLDIAGRTWQVVVYCGDDLAFRLRFRKVALSAHILIVLARGTHPSGKINCSYIADILARNEAGPPLNLSVPAFFGRLCPKINFPVAEIRQYKDALLERLDNVPKATAKIIERWGRPDDWGRGQVAALVLLAHHPDMTLKELWPDEPDSSEFLVHVLRLLIGHPALSKQRAILNEMIEEAARPQVKENLYWLQMPLEEIAAYLVLRHFAAAAGLQNPATQLAGLHIFALETPVSEMEKQAGGLIEHVTADATLWPAVQRQAEAFLPPKVLQKVLDLAAPAGKTPVERIAGILQRPLVPIILHEALRAAFLTFLADPSVAKTGMLASLARQPLIGTPQDDDSDRSRQCRMGIQCLTILGQIESRLAKPIPKFLHADALLNWYLENGYHMLELQLAQAFHLLEGFDDSEVTQAGQQYLFGGPDDVAPSAESLKGRLIERLDALDHALAGFVRADPAAFTQSPRSSLHLLRDALKEDVGRIGLGQNTGKVWILVFDGMRFDTWEMVVQPILAEHFEVKGQASFCILPSFTQVARTSLLAGCLPSDWKGFKGAHTSDEVTLVARNLGLTAQEAKAKLRFVTEADTEKARMMLGFVDKEVAPLNVLIYPVSDECHDFRGDLAAFNYKIRVTMLGDKIQGVRGILDDLLKRIRAEDTVMVVSDHGFTELLGTHSIPVTQSEAAVNGRDLQADVHWRYTFGFSPKDFPEAVQITTGTEQCAVAVGRKWFRRDTAKAVPRYSHGGLSLAEIVVPGFKLRRVTEKTAQVELEGVPVSAIAVGEDSSVELTFAIRNSGNVVASFELRVRTNLGEDVVSQDGKLPPGGSSPVRCTIVGRYRETPSREMDMQGSLTAVSIRLRHTDLSGNWRDAIGGLEMVSVMVQPKQTKLDTDALKGFDDIS
jgi:hypothetical protein